MSDVKVITWSNGQTAVELPNAEISRPFSFEGGWTKIRVGVLIGVTTGSRDSISSQAFFAVGISSGKEAFGSTGTPRHYICVWQGTGAISYFSGSTTTYYSSYQNLYAAVGSSGSYVYSGVINTSQYFRPSTNDANKGVVPMFVDITKGDPNYTVQAFYPNGVANGTGYVTEEQLLREMQSTTPSYNATTEANIATTTAAEIAVSEASGSFDHAFVMWGREAPNPSLVVSAIAVARLA